MYGNPLFEEVSKHTELKPCGKQFNGLSPFTHEKTPSFFVNPSKLGGCWKCFSTGEGGQGVESFKERMKHVKPHKKVVLPPLEPGNGGMPF